MKDFSTVQTITSSSQRVADLLCSAFEGGSNYWYEEVEPKVLAPGLTRQDFSKDGKMQGEPYAHWSTLIAMTEGCSITFRVAESSPYAADKLPAGFPLTVKDDVCHVTLDRAAIEKGVALFPVKEPKHFADFMAALDDATTGDVFLQLCCFGEVVFA